MGFALNILIFNSFYLPYIKGGAEVVVKLIAEGLVAEGHAVTVVSTVGSPNPEQKLINGVTSIQIKTPNLYWAYEKVAGSYKKLLWHFIDNWNPFARKRVKLLIQSCSPDVIVTHNLAGFSSSVWSCARSLNVPIVHVVHDYYLMCPKSSLLSKCGACKKQCITCKAARIGMKSRTNQISKVVFVSDFLKRKFITNGFFNDVPNEVIHNSIEPKNIERNLQQNSDLVFGFIGRVSYEKGIETLLEAFNKISSIKNKYSKIRLKIAGEVDETYRHYLVSKYGDSAEFLGKVDPIDFYSKINICVVPSIWEEPFGLVAVEALHAGLPVIASDSGGLNEIVKDGVNGLIFPKGNVDELVKKICLLHDDEQLFKTLRSYTRQSVFGFINVHEFIQKHINVYLKVIERKSNSR